MVNDICRLNPISLLVEEPCDKNDSTRSVTLYRSQSLLSDNSSQKYLRFSIGIFYVLNPTTTSCTSLCK